MIGQWFGAYAGHWYGWRSGTGIQHVRDTDFLAVATLRDLDEQQGLRAFTQPQQQRDFDESRSITQIAHAGLADRTAARSPDQTAKRTRTSKAVTRRCETTFLDRKR